MRISDWSSDLCSFDLFTTNEPDQLALQQAIEKAVYSLIMEGVDLKLWDFADPKAGWPMLYNYRREREGEFTAAQVQAAMEQMHKYAPTNQKKTDEVALNKAMQLRMREPNKPDLQNRFRR